MGLRGIEMFLTLINVRQKRLEVYMHEINLTYWGIMLSRLANGCHVYPVG